MVFRRSCICIRRCVCDYDCDCDLRSDGTVDCKKAYLSEVVVVVVVVELFKGIVVPRPECTFRPVAGVGRYCRKFKVGADL